MSQNENPINPEQTAAEEVKNTEAQPVEESAQETPVADDTTESTTDEATSELSAEEKVAALEAKIAEQEATIAQLQKDALYRAAEFENYRKRVLQEKADLIKYGSQKAIEALLPVIDDLDRAMQHIEKADDVASLKEGVALIMEKFQGYLKQQQVTVIPAAPGDDFDDSIHEAITMFPAPDPSLKGKIVDCPTKGYKLVDKVIRYAKVVVGQ